MTSSAKLPRTLFKRVLCLMFASALIAFHGPVADAGAGGTRWWAKDSAQRGPPTIVQHAEMNLTETAQKFDRGELLYTPSKDIRVFGAQLGARRQLAVQRLRRGTCEANPHRERISRRRRRRAPTSSGSRGFVCVATPAFANLPEQTRFGARSPRQNEVARGSVLTNASSTAMRSTEF